MKQESHKDEASSSKRIAPVFMNMSAQGFKGTNKQQRRNLSNVIRGGTETPNNISQTSFSVSERKSGLEHLKVTKQTISNQNLNQYTINSQSNKSQVDDEIKRKFLKLMKKNQDQFQHINQVKGTKMYFNKPQVDVKQIYSKNKKPIVMPNSKPNRVSSQIIKHKNSHKNRNSIDFSTQNITLLEYLTKTCEKS